MNNSKLSVFAINLRKRVDRKENLMSEFAHRTEFNLTFIEPLSDSRPNVSLWRTIVHIIKNVNNNEDVIVICEDDHQFTGGYTKELLFNAIENAKDHNADILSGGVSCVSCTFKTSDCILWMEDFTGMQFTVVFRKFFESILNVKFQSDDDADIVISKMTSSKFLIDPFISTQKYFGYSDVTVDNSIKGRVDALFISSSEEVKLAKNVTRYYQEIHKNTISVSPVLEEGSIPTYIIVEDNKENTDSILKEFFGKTEFDVSLVKAVKRKKQNLGAWLTLRKIIKQAIKNDNDLILVCESGHRFNNHYNRQFLFNQIGEAHLENADILLGFAGNYQNPILVSNNRFWIKSFTDSQFVIIYKKSYKTILNEPHNESKRVDELVSAMFTNKLVIFPFISFEELIQNCYHNVRPSYTQNRLNAFYNSSFSRLEKLRLQMSKFMK